MKRILLDTNCLVYAVQHKLDILSHIHDAYPGESSIEVPSDVLSELGGLTNRGKGESKINAGVALGMLKKWIADEKVKLIKSDMPVDDWLVLQAKENENVVVCTYDAKLKQYLKELGVQIHIPKGHKRP